MDMKKINIGAFVIAGAMLMTASGCTDSDFDSKYEDPSKAVSYTHLLRTRIDRFGVVQPNIQSLEDKMGRIMPMRRFSVSLLWW